VSWVGGGKGREGGEETDLQLFHFPLPIFSESSSSNLSPPFFLHHLISSNINLKKLKAQGVTLDEVVRYYIFLTE